MHAYQAVSYVVCGYYSLGLLSCDRVLEVLPVHVVQSANYTFTAGYHPCVSRFPTLLVEFQAIKDLAELRRNPAKMAAYEADVRVHLVRVRARGRVTVKARVRVRIRVGGEDAG